MNIIQGLMEYISKNLVDPTYNNPNEFFGDDTIFERAMKFYKLFESERTRGQLVLSKISPERHENRLAVSTEFLTPMEWGIRFEPVVKKYLEKTWNCQIYECGRVTHPKEHLGASPDGLIITEGERYGRLVEIKCPYSRKIEEGTIPEDYWIQMQIQLEVTQLYECEYFEVEILSKTPKNMNPNFEKIDGEVYLIMKDDIYSYNYDCLVPDGYELVEKIPYAIVKTHNKLVYRDKKWYEETVPKQQVFWEDVEKAKKGEFVLPEARVRKRKDECLIVDNE